MIEKEVLQDIRQYKKRLIGPFTTREFICVALAVVVCVPVYFVASKYLVRNAVIGIICILATPFILCGYKEMYGMPFEKFVMRLVRNTLMKTRNRKYASVNIYDELAEKQEITLTKKELKELKKEAKQNKDPDFKAI